MRSPPRTTPPLKGGREREEEEEGILTARGKNVGWLAERNGSFTSRNGSPCPPPPKKARLEIGHAFPALGGGDDQRHQGASRQLIIGKGFLDLLNLMWYIVEVEDKQRISSYTSLPFTNPT